MAFALPVWFAVQNELIGNSVAEGTSPGFFDDFDDDALFKTFHLSRPCITFITDNIRLRMKRHPKRPGVPVDAMVMVALNYYALGVSSVAVLQKAGINHAECAEVICTVSKVIASMGDQFISFPVTRDARANVAYKIERHCGIPSVLGIVSAAHFKIRASPYEKDAFRSFLNTLGYTSLMTQIICDCDGNILSAENCCVGSTSEQELWDSSFKGREMEEEMHGQYWIVGGKSYNLSNYVLTAVSKPANDKEIAFNKAHAKILAVMWTTLVSIKSRFRCLLQLGFAQVNSLDKQANTIRACCVLHNIAKKFSVPSPSLAGKFEPVHPGKLHKTPAAEIKPEALRARQDLINTVFSAVSSTQDPVTGDNTVEDV